MKKLVVLALALMVCAAPAFAGLWVHSTVELKPILSGAPLPVPNVLDIDPGFKPVVDKFGNPVIDAETNMQKMEPTWVKFMSGATIPGVTKVTYQSAILCKKHPERKAACDFQWCSDPVCQVGMDRDSDGVFIKNNINLHWPLMFETHSTTFTLTLTYATDKAVALYPGYRPSRVHTEVYVWHIQANDWIDLENAIALFYNLTAGQCELGMITSAAVRDKLVWYLNGTPAQFGKVAILGLKDLITQGKVAEAQARFGQLEEYIDSMCWAGCVSCPQPGPNVNGIVNTDCAPVASILLNDVWNIAKAKGIFLAD